LEEKVRASHARSWLGRRESAALFCYPPVANDQILLMWREIIGGKAAATKAPGAGSPAAKTKISRSKKVKPHRRFHAGVSMFSQACFWTVQP
jgi:hypothetical protein